MITSMMTMSKRGFHEGELAVQGMAGLTAAAARLEGMLAPVEKISDGMRRVLADREFAVITGRDEAGVLWTSPLLSEKGFLNAERAKLMIKARPETGDPLHSIRHGQDVGLLSVDFATRRRIRINGHLERCDNEGMLVETVEAYGNCPSYIHERIVRRGPGMGRQQSRTSSTELSAADRQLLERADTIFVGTVHPTRGVDSSHKGGRPGFVRVDEDVIWWPDYAGNNMFNSLGNIATSGECSLVVIDFTGDRMVQLTGVAEIGWTKRGTRGDDGATGRRVVLRPTRIIRGASTLEAEEGKPSRDNPALA